MRSIYATAALACAVTLGAPGCSGTDRADLRKEEEAPAALKRDVHSYGRPEHAKVVHMEFDWDVLFDEEVLQGVAVLHLERAPGAPPELRLDTRDLTIIGVKAGTEAGEMKTVPFRLGEPDAHLGSEMVVDLPDAAADRVAIEYRTSPQASGLQWLSRDQTTGGEHPFLYTQSQAIHARSWIPCQDSPAVRVTFDATIRLDRPLRAVMAADEVSAQGGVFRYTMPHSIPSYLIALAAGDLKFGEVGPRTGVWAEPAVLDRAVKEFADMEDMLASAERLYGKYRWTRYDLLVLPPSFPFGGMENPMLTFATPTILAGDRSLVSLVAHELAHSWSGNLVTNATWSDFWLNEGFTTYLERRIMEEVFGEARADMEWVLGRQDLEEDLTITLADKPGDQILEIDLEGRDPDDGFSNVPYEKGALFLRHLEVTYGREAFDPALKKWFDQHAFRSVTTDDLRAFLAENLTAPKEGMAAPDLQAWITQAGLPEEAPEVVSGEFARVDEAVSAWAGGKVAASAIDTTGWTTHHWRHFLRTLPASMGADRMAKLDEAFGFTRTGNSEVLSEWLVLSVRHGYEPAYDRLAWFLTTQGRRKFLTPLYREMAGTDEGSRMGLDIYTKARPLYHIISRRTLDPIVGWAETAANR